MLAPPLNVSTNLCQFISRWTSTRLEATQGRMYCQLSGFGTRINAETVYSSLTVNAKPAVNVNLINIA